MKEGSVNRFNCRRCGACCRVPGYVHLTDDDIGRAAMHLGLSSYEFTARYTRLTTNRAGLSLIEQNDGACVFLGQRNHCRLQEVKPAQCEGFPRIWHFNDMESVCKGWNDEKHDAG